MGIKHIYIKEVHLGFNPFHLKWHTLNDFHLSCHYLVHLFLLVPIENKPFNIDQLILIMRCKENHTNNLLQSKLKQKLSNYNCNSNSRSISKSIQ